MRNLVYIIIILILIMVGCSDKSNQLVNYDKKEVLSSLCQLSFDPEVPSLLPFEPKETIIDVMNVGGMDNNFIAVSFVNEKGEEITFRAGTIRNVFDFTEEIVEIQRNLEGEYGEKDDAKILMWKKDDIHYELFLDSESFSKEDVLKVAKSFERIN